MPLGKCLRRGRRQQPRCQYVLAGAGPGGAQPLEQRAGAEQVQIGGVRVVQIEKTDSADPGSGPPILHPGQPLCIEVHRPAGPPAPPAQRLMNHDKSDEESQRQDQPESTWPVHSIDEKCQHQPGREDNQTCIGYLLFQPAPALASRSSLVMAALILGPEILLRGCHSVDLLHFLVRRVTGDKQSCKVADPDLALKTLECWRLRRFTRIWLLYSFCPVC